MKNLELDDNGWFKIVFNSGYGGFGLSKIAILRLIELGSKEAEKSYREHQAFGSNYANIDPGLERYDSILIQVVEELGSEACGSSCDLAIGKINLNQLVEFENYDGKEEIKGCYDIVYYDRNK